MRAWRGTLAAVMVVALAAAGCGQDSSGDDDGNGGMGGEGGAGGQGGMPDAGARDGAPPDANHPDCSDGADNDGDGKVDGDDPGCDGPDDRDERDPPPPPACANGEDDDADGYRDFPEDPGCASAGDDDETNDAPLPQCGDSLDNERDGLVDEEDPGCSSVADPSEADLATPPACSNGLDDDADGVIDFPNEPGCSAAGDEDEANPAQAPACGNGSDDDGDGLIDYPLDPGCAGVGDRDETDKAIQPQCANGRDDDGDGKIDFPDDDGCRAASDYNEAGSCGRQYSPASLSDGQTLVVDIARGVFRAEGTCGGAGSPEVVYHYRLNRAVEALRISTEGAATTTATTLYVRRTACLDAGAEVACQRDEGEPGHTLLLEEPAAGDYYIFVDGAQGRGGPVQLTVSEVALAACRNGLDDDEDGRVDYPNEPGCDDPADRDETDPDEPPACANDADDDRDGRVDFPLDAGCIAASGRDEVDRCGQGVRFKDWPFNQDSVLYDVAVDGTNAAAGSCGGLNQPEVIVRYSNPINARLTFSTQHEDTQFTPTLYVRTECSTAGSERGCVEPLQAGALAGRITVDRASPGEYYLFVDSALGMRDGTRVRVSVDVEPLAPGCSDGRDGDGDGEVDADDPGCAGPDDQDERDPPRGSPPSACRNLEDDDGDGLADYPYDPGCAALGDDDETDPDAPPPCSNGLDDDGDGRIDFPADPGCQSRGDTEERNPVPPPACGNAIDDDMDGIADYPNDPGCLSAGDANEADPAQRPVCSNGVDDDRDGIADFPFDRGCIAASHNSEVDPEVPPVCSNGADDDMDDRPDFPLDPGCTYAADPSEENQGFNNQCANGRDDDADGRTDFPDDPGCRFAADNDEVNPGFLPPRCGDGVDNDFDGFVDLQDIGCLDGGDDDEGDPDVVPLCGNAMDDDEDDLADWPNDPGCQARGDLTESQACRPERATPLIPRNGTVRGATAEDEPDDYNARCGGRNAPDAVYKYVLAQAATLRISAANEGTDYPVVVSVRNDCEEPSSMLACAGDFARPEPTVTLQDAEPGEYYIFIDGAGPERYVSGGRPVVMPNDPRNFQAQHNERDPSPGCGWADGGNDGFDCFGRFTFAHQGARNENIDPSIGSRPYNVGGYAFTFSSDFPAQNLWRVRFVPQEEFDDRPVTITVTGNLGSDGSTVAAVRNIEFEGRQVSYLNTAERDFANPAFDPPIVFMMLPADPEELGRVRYQNNNDNITITATDIKLPATFYVALTYAENGAVAQAILTDVELQAGPGGEDAPRFGNFEVSVQEQ